MIYNDDVLSDIIIIDDMPEKALELHNKNVKAPIFLLLSNIEDFNSNAQYYRVIKKPIVLSSLLNEIKSSINIYENSMDGYLNFNQYVLMPITKEILNERNGELVKLTEKEVSILKYLYKAQERIVTKNELLQNVWGYSLDVSTHTVETHVYRLRQKVELDDANTHLVMTIDGGYQLKI